MEKEQYQIEYEEFIKDYASGVTTGEGVGIVIARLAQYFTEANLNHAQALIKFNGIASIVEERIEESGKPISNAKAKVVSAATPESATLIFAKAHLDNIEQKINSLKSLQKGILNEYSHMGTA